jgi:uncharacterized protein
MVVTKPIGPRCNLNCSYCYYLEKEALYPDATKFVMDAGLLETYVRDYIRSQSIFGADRIQFIWQGGEPTILGVDWFRNVVGLQRKYAPPGVDVANALQTNATLIDGEWAAFLRENRFLVGVSIDGPPDMHDRYRRDRAGRPSFDKVMAGIERLKTHGVDFNTLTVVNRHSAAEPKRLYRFLVEAGSKYLQFIPAVERSADGRSLAPPPQIDEDGVEYPVTPWSVLPGAWGDFLCDVFDAWVAADVGRIFVQLFDVQLGLRLGGPAQLCWFAETCGDGPALEHNGDLYACDHYVYPEYRLGNIAETSLAVLANRPEQRAFGAAKRTGLPSQCRGCSVLRACNGGCPKHRFATTKDGKPGLSYFCRPMRRFLRHVDRQLGAMADLIRAGRPIERVMTKRRNAKSPRS